MKNLYDNKELEAFYTQNHDATMAELNKMIIALRTRCQYLEKRLEENLKEAEGSITAPIKWRIENLENQNTNLKKELKERERTGVSREVEREIQKMMKEQEKLIEDLEFYKSKVPDWVIINRENKKKPTREGGIPKSSAPRKGGIPR